MQIGWKAVCVALGILLALGLILAMTLTHYIGGFFRTVEKEAEEEAAQRERDAENDKHRENEV